MDDQERICKWCEENILGCRHSTQTFLCEGAFCEQAAADIKDVYPFNLVRPKPFKLHN